MARYFFHLHDRSGQTVDQLGREIADLDEARRRANKAARAIIQADVGSGIIDLTARIEVTDAEGEVVLTLPFDEAIELITGRAGP
jgi:dihydroxyacetone kinase DhaKLM complex PTS-EIIA-like component DhaM